MRELIFNPEALTIVAAIFELTGIYMLGKKKRIGFILNMIAGVQWITYSMITHSAYGLIMICSIALILNTKGFINWRKNND